jgi:hypothetical protein
VRISHYVAFMGKCDKNPKEFENVQKMCMEVANNYKARCNGIMRDITEENHIAFSGVFLIECNEGNYIETSNKIQSELENKMFIHSFMGGTIV